MLSTAILPSSSRRWGQEWLKRQSVDRKAEGHLAYSDGNGTLDLAFCT